VLARFLPDATTLRLEACHVDTTAAQLSLRVTSTQTDVCGPLCDVPAQHRHSWYERTLADLPWGTYGVRLRRRVRSHHRQARPTARVVGVDDWAFHQGHRYGPLLVDLERRQPIDLLPDREAATLAAWLKAPPGLQIMTRDRAAKYAEGAREGAPHAVQVADRWHLLKNLREAVQRFLTRRHACLEQATAVLTQGQLLEQTTTAGPVAMLSSRRAQERQHNRAKRYARYCQGLALHHQGCLTATERANAADEPGHHPPIRLCRTLARAGDVPAPESTRSVCGLFASPLDSGM
jgi:transposase